jgi:hypothetical protein
VRLVSALSNASRWSRSGTSFDEVSIQNVPE